MRPTLPLVVLPHGLPAVLPPDLVLPPGYPDAATLERASRAAQKELATILPYHGTSSPEEAGTTSTPPNRTW